jgi:hypothetical protein
VIRKVSWKGIFFACALAGCGGAPSAGLDTAQDSTPDDGCGPHATRLGAECWSAEGTRWEVLADGPGGPYELELELLAAGRVRATDHATASPARDEWFQDGAVVRVLLADRFVEYRATVTNGTVLVGEAMNVRGERWSFRAQRLFTEGRCANGEARLPNDACMTVEGTRWELARGGAARRIELLAGGAVGTSSADPAEGDRWVQEGSTVRLTIGDAELTGELESADVLRGEGFTATRVPSLPPLMWR